MAQRVDVHAADARFQWLLSLQRNRRKRSKERRFVVEGVRSIDQLAKRDDWPIDAFIFDGQRLLSSWARQHLTGSRASEHLALSSSLMAELSEKRDTSELLAVARMPADDLSRIPTADDVVLVLADRPASPGNLGTLIRSVDALGGHGVLVYGHGVDPYEPATIRAAAGSLFAVPVVRVESRSALVDWLDELRARLPAIQIVGTSAHAAETLWEAPLSAPLLLLCGNETSGVAHNLLDLADMVIRIPLVGSASSLNVACAMTATLTEIARRRSQS